jgi:hypothetical protein
MSTLVALTITSNTITHHFDTPLVQSAERWYECAGDFVNPRLVMETRVL